MTTPEFPFEIEPELPGNLDVPIGCIGAGFIMADCHLVAYRSAGFNPVAIASRTEERAREAAERHAIPTVHADWHELLADEQVEVVDIAVPPDNQLEVVREAVRHAGHVRGILAQKPLGVDHAQAREIVSLCRDAGIVLAVNQNMRFDQSIRAVKGLLDAGILGTPVLATIDMRAIPHWMPWQQRQGWVTLRIMSIHHLDTFRYLFGDPERVFASVRPDPRTAAQFDHEDGICLYILEYADGLRAASWDDVWSAFAGGSRVPRGWLEGPSAGPTIPTAARARSTIRSRRRPSGFHLAGTRCGFPTRSSARWPTCCVHSSRTGHRRSAATTTSRRWRWSMPVTARHANTGR